jgi:hypothetical protein
MTHITISSYAGSAELYSAIIEMYEAAWEQVTISRADAPNKPLAQAKRSQFLFSLLNLGIENECDLVLTEW